MDHVRVESSSVGAMVFETAPVVASAGRVVGHGTLELVIWITGPAFFSYCRDCGAVF